MSWTESCYSRILIDNHITEDDPSFMSRFEPENYVRMVKASGVESSMVYACCHNGNCYYPTKVGHMHANLKGRDVFGETVNLLRKNGVIPIAYYTSVYHNHSAKTNPAWRVTHANGTQHGGRYWWSCPNNEDYVAFAIAQVEEIVSYDVDGLFNDMTFWPGICACQSCREKFLKETGREIPTKIDWFDKGWVAFQRFRERSMATFTQRLTDAIKAKRNITVTHQTSTIMSGWVTSYTLGIANACDYASGDFYGGKRQHILGAKILAAASKTMPYEFMTSRCVNLRDHTSMKSEPELLAEAATTLASGGSYFFIDAINPDGTLEPEVYARLGRVAKTLSPFVEALKKHVPSIVADKALYYSSSAYVDSASNCDIMSALPPEKPAAEELSGTSQVLTRSHIPFKAAHAQTASFEGLDAIVMNDVMYMDADECAKIRKFVADGGTLIATGKTSLLNQDGSGSGDFALADVFGVTYTGSKSKSFHYLSFADGRQLVSCHSSAPLVKATSAKVLAKITEPLFSPEEERYASIHSNPPGKETEFAALTVNSYGKGRCVYLSSRVMALSQDAQRDFGSWLFSEFSPSSIVEETNAPACVEITLLKSSKSKAYLAGFVNFQLEMPNVPVKDLYALIRLPGGAKPKSCVRVSDGKSVGVKTEGGAIRLEIPSLETIELFEIGF